MNTSGASQNQRNNPSEDDDSTIPDLSVLMDTGNDSTTTLPAAPINATSNLDDSSDPSSPSVPPKKLNKGILIAILLFFFISLPIIGIVVTQQRQIADIRNHAAYSGQPCSTGEVGNTTCTDGLIYQCNLNNGTPIWDSTERMCDNTTILCSTSSSSDCSGMADGDGCGPNFSGKCRVTNTSNNGCTCVNIPASSCIGQCTGDPVGTQYSIGRKCLGNNGQCYSCNSLGQFTTVPVSQCTPPTNFTCKEECINAGYSESQCPTRRCADPTCAGGFCQEPGGTCGTLGYVTTPQGCESIAGVSCCPGGTGPTKTPTPIPGCSNPNGGTHRECLSGSCVTVNNAPGVCDNEDNNTCDTNNQCTSGGATNTPRPPTSTPTRTPTPTAGPSATPNPSGTPTNTPTRTPTPTTGPSSTPNPSANPTSIPSNSPNPSTTPVLTNPPTMTPIIGECQNIKIYKNGVVIIPSPSTLSKGDQIVIAVVGSNATQARIRINNEVNWRISTTKNSNGEWIFNYTLPSDGTLSFAITAELLIAGVWQ